MIVLVATIELYLPGMASLKEKRGSLKSLIARLRKKFNIAIAEIDLHDAWQSASLGVAIISTGEAHTEAVLESILSWIERHRPDVEVMGYTQEILHINLG